MSEDRQPLSPMFLRKRAGLTQAQVAGLLGKSLSTVVKWESRTFVPKGSPSEIKKLCEVYQCSLDELIEAFELSAGSARNKSSAQSGDDLN